MSDSDRAVVQWLLLEGDRNAVAVALLIGVFLVLVGLGRAGIVTVYDPAAVRQVAGGLIPGLFAFRSIVLAINQLVLSQEFGSADEIRTRTREIRDYRRNLEEATETAPTPVLPTEFLGVIARTVESNAAAVEDGLETDVDGRRESIADSAETVGADAREVTETLRESAPGRVNAILSALEYPYSRQRYEARHLLDTHGTAFRPRPKTRSPTSSTRSYSSASPAPTSERRTRSGYWRGCRGCCCTRASRRSSRRSSRGC